MNFTCLFSLLLFKIKIPAFYVLLFLFLPVLHEFLQYFEPSLGTFDIFDVILYLVIIILYFFILKKEHAKRS
jgi:hypothetical protein